VTAFAEMMTARTGSRDLEGWLAAVEADDQPDLRSLVAGIRHDQQAVTNGLTLPYSSGKVEGTANKMLKRQMYGRAGFDLQARHLAPCITRTTNSRKSQKFPAERRTSAANFTRTSKPSPKQDNYYVCPDIAL
jgi:hypothetical protein